MVALGGGTVLGTILLFFIGSKGAQRYDEAKDSYAAAAEEASSFERLALYPKTENKDGKNKALGEYRQAVESLQSTFQPFRPSEIKNISPQEFTTRLLAANAEVRKAFDDVNTKVPEALFLGFEGYKTSLAPGNTTGILNYQLNSIKDLLLSLAKVKPTELKNLYRPNLPEEDGQPFNPPPLAVARSFPLEVTFTGPEKAAREFLSSISKADNKYVTIRSLRISNTKKDPPRAADAQFEKAPEAKSSSGSDAFAGGYVSPGEVAATEPTAAAPKVADSSRILSQVLGNEEVLVFVRLDFLQFLPAKKLP